MAELGLERTRGVHGIQEEDFYKVGGVDEEGILRRQDVRMETDMESGCQEGWDYSGKCWDFWENPLGPLLIAAQRKWQLSTKTQST